MKCTIAGFNGNLLQLHSFSFRTNVAKNQTIFVFNFRKWFHLSYIRGTKAKIPSFVYQNFNSTTHFCSELHLGNFEALGGQPKSEIHDQIGFFILILTPPKVKTFEFQIPICQLFLHLFLPYNSEHFHEFVFLKNPKNRILRTIVQFHDEFLHDGFLWMWNFDPKLSPKDCEVTIVPWKREEDGVQVLQTWL